MGLHVLSVQRTKLNILCPGTVTASAAVAYVSVCPVLALLRFQASVGTVTYLPDLDCIKWSIKQYYGQRDFLMRAHFGLPSVAAGMLIFVCIVCALVC